MSGISTKGNFISYAAQGKLTEFVVAQSVDRVDLASELQHLSADIIEESDTLSDTGLLLLPTLRYLADVVREQHHLRRSGRVKTRLREHLRSG